MFHISQIMGYVDISGNIVYGRVICQTMLGRTYASYHRMCRTTPQVTNDYRTEHIEGYTIFPTNQTHSFNHIYFTINNITKNKYKSQFQAQK